MSNPTGPAPLQTASRWAEWEHQVLSIVDPTGECIKIVLQRQHAVDDDREEAEEVKAQFEYELGRRGYVPDVTCVYIPSRVAAEWLAKVTNKTRPTNQATSFLAMLAIGELKKTKKYGGPGWRWMGAKAKAVGGGEPGMSYLRPSASQQLPVCSPSNHLPPVPSDRSAD